jgi:hypothetical protein
MADIFDELEVQPKKRTTFITVLCILTFIYSTYSLFSSAYTYFNAEKTAIETKKEADKAITNENGSQDKKSQAIVKKMMGSMVESFTKENLQKLSIAGIIDAILCLSGAFLMFRINKKGYILYVAGVTVGIIVPLMIFGSNIMGIAMSVITGFFGLVFCILYGVNLKDMK